MSKLKRETRETQIICDARPGSGRADVRVDDRVLRHVLEILARYGGVDLDIEATGDLRHHLVEDVAIVLGRALADEIPERAARYGWAVVPMDDALAEAAIDVGGRPWYEGRLPSKLYTHFLHSFATNLGATLHVRVLRGSDVHHRVEASIKAVGLALRQAMAVGDGEGVFSTKGAVELERLD